MSPDEKFLGFFFPFFLFKYFKSVVKNKVTFIYLFIFENHQKKEIFS